MNLPRRTLAEAMQRPAVSPEAIALIKEGTPKPLTQNPVFAVAKAEAPREPLPSSAPAPAAVESRPVPKPKPQKEMPAETIALVSMNFRVPATIPAALLKASSERKMNKVRPFTQQDIVTEALSGWLHKNGYLQ